MALVYVAIDCLTRPLRYCAIPRSIRCLALGSSVVVDEVNDVLLLQQRLVACRLWRNRLRHFLGHAAATTMRQIDEVG
jgi:hypothetical protein